VDFLASLTRNLLTTLGNSTLASTVQLTFNPPLPANLRDQLTDKSIVLTLTNVRGNQATFTGPDGSTFTATASTPLPLGTRISITAGQLPATPQPPTGGLAPLPPLTAQLLPAAGQTSVPAGAPAIQIQQSAAPTPPPQPAQPQGPPPVQISLGGATVQNIITTATLAATQAAANSTLPAIPLPPGPLAAAYPQTMPPSSWLNQPLQLVATQPFNPATQTQTAQLTNPQLPGSPPVQVTLTPGQPLPSNTPLTATLTPAPNQPTLILTQPSRSPLPPTLSGAPTTLNLPATAAPLLSGTLITARVLPQNIAIPTPPGTQPVLLANGQTATVQSTQPFVTGSILVAEIPTIPAAPQVLRVQSSGPQTQQNQPNTTQPAPQVNAQANTVTLPAGATIQGTITGVAENGQPLFTISQPSVLAGHTVPLTLNPLPTNAGEAAPILTTGTQLTIKVEANSTASILNVVLAPEAARANTVSTLGTQWTTLLQALQTLDANSPAQATDLRNRIPQLANILPGILTFTDALRRSRPDDQVAALAGRDTANLLKALGVDLSADTQHLSQLQQRTHAENGDPQWRGTLFPYVEAVGEDPRQGGFFWRREKEDDPRSPTNTRFVVEVDMSSIGPVQLDGLVSYPEVWLKLRRTTAPESGFTEDLQNLVTSTLQSFGLSGGIAVEVTSQFPVNPRAEMLATSPAPLPTTA
jgi:hypothetical protein